MDAPHVPAGARCRCVRRRHHRHHRRQPVRRQPPHGVGGYPDRADRRHRDRDHAVWRYRRPEHVRPVRRRQLLREACQHRDPRRAGAAGERLGRLRAAAHLPEGAVRRRSGRCHSGHRIREPGPLAFHLDGHLDERLAGWWRRRHGLGGSLARQPAGGHGRSRRGIARRVGAPAHAGIHPPGGRHPAQRWHVRRGHRGVRSAHVRGAAGDGRD